MKLNGLEPNHKNRSNKKGGGVALYVNNRLKYKIVENMTTAIDNVMECITVEICLEKRKSIIVSFVCRALGSNIKIFKNVMGRIFATTNQKLIFVCGDFNMDLLNPNNHKATDEFIDAMFSMSLFPLNQAE